MCPLVDRSTADQTDFGLCFLLGSGLPPTPNGTTGTLRLLFHVSSAVRVTYFHRLLFRGAFCLRTGRFLNHLRKKISITTTLIRLKLHQREQ